MAVSTLVLAGSVVIALIVAVLPYSLSLPRLREPIRVAVEALRAFPLLVVALLFVSLGVRGTWLITLYAWIPFWRVLDRDLALEIERPYCLMARLAGFSALRVVLSEAGPGAIVRALPYLGTLFGQILGVSSTLDFLGYGLPFDRPSLGGLIAQASDLGWSAPWVWLPSLVLLITFAGLAQGVTSMRLRSRAQELL